MDKLNISKFVYYDFNILMSINRLLRSNELGVDVRYCLSGASQPAAEQWTGLWETASCPERGISTSSRHSRRFFVAKGFKAYFFIGHFLRSVYLVENHIDCSCFLNVLIGLQFRNRRVRVLQITCYFVIFISGT